MKCVVCGADVIKSRRRRDELMGSGTNTCDTICTRAKHAGRSRMEQIWADDEEDQRREARDKLINPISTP